MLDKKHPVGHEQTTCDGTNKKTGLYWSGTVKYIVNDFVRNHPV